MNYRTYQIAFKRNNPTILSRASIPLLPAEWEALYTHGPRKWLSTGTPTQQCFASQADHVNGYANQYPAQSSQKHDRGKVRVITSLHRKYWDFTNDGHLMLCSILLVSTRIAAIMRLYVCLAADDDTTTAQQRLSRCGRWEFLLKFVHKHQIMVKSRFKTKTGTLHKDLLVFLRSSHT